MEPGDAVVKAALDALGLLYEDIDKPQLLAVSVTLVALDSDDGVYTACATWAPEGG